MDEIVAADLPFDAQEVTRDEAIELFAKRNEKFKVEISGIPEGERSRCTRTATGSTSASAARPVDRRDRRSSCSRSPAPTGAAITQQDAPADLRHRVLRQEGARRVAQAAEEAEKRDHRKLGKELDLFEFHPFAPGAAFWPPKGTALYTMLAEYMRKLLLDERLRRDQDAAALQQGAVGALGPLGQVQREHVQSSRPRSRSFSLKPMNCPAHLHLQHGAARATAICRCACTRRTCCTATRPRARSAA